MNPEALVDTSVLVRFAREDHPDHSARSLAYVRAVAREERIVRLLDTVIFETVFTLEKHYKAERLFIRDRILPIIRLDAVVLPHKHIYDEVFDIWLTNAGFSFADCYHLVMTHELGIPAILAFDKKMSRYAKVQRVEPGPLA